MAGMDISFPIVNAGPTYRRRRRWLEPQRCHRYRRKSGTESSCTEWVSGDGDDNRRVQPTYSSCWKLPAASEVPLEELLLVEVADAVASDALAVAVAVAQLSSRMYTVRTSWGSGAAWTPTNATAEAIRARSERRAIATS